MNASAPERESLDARLARLAPYIESTRYALTEDDVRHDYETGRDRYAEDDLRDVAVAITDRRHGYTAEFAPDPLAHFAEYDHTHEQLLEGRLLCPWLLTQGHGGTGELTAGRCGDCGYDLQTGEWS